MKYKILEYDDSEYLQKAVNISLKDGWKLQGGVSVTVSESDDYRYVIYAQAIVKVN